MRGHHLHDRPELEGAAWRPAGGHPGAKAPEPQSPGRLSGAARLLLPPGLRAARHSDWQVRARRRSWARGAEVGVRGSRGAEVRLSEEGAAAARPHSASAATGSAGGAAGRAPEAPWPLSCAPLLRRERLEPSEPRGPAAPAAPVPWKRARRAPASAPTERLKRQPLRHRGLGEPLAPSPPPTSSSLPPLTRPAGARCWGLERPLRSKIRGFAQFSRLTLLPTPSYPPTYPTHIPAQHTHPNPAKQAKRPWLSPPFTNLLRTRPAAHLPRAEAKRRLTLDSLSHPKSRESVRTQAWGSCV